MRLAQMIQPEEISVLLIEDSAGDANAITKALVYGESGYNFTIARTETLAEGLDFIGSKKTDVLLLDLNLPDAKETQAIKEIRKTYVDVPIVVISGSSDMNIVHRALHNGAQEFLVKGECSGATIRQSIYQAIVRKQIEKAYECGDKL